VSYVDILVATGASLFFLAVVFIPMEKVFPAREGQPIFRAEWILDLCYFLGQYLLWSGLVLSCLLYFNEALQHVVPQAFQQWIQKQPVWLQAVEVIVLSDFIIYWGHRLQHKVDFLWRFHKVHHSAKSLDWLAAHREHPIDSIYTIGLINLPAFVLGFNLDAIVMFIAFLELGPLKKLIGSPDLHHWHHDLERDRGNYANISPLMDVLFGTYVCPNTEPEKLGIKEEFSQNYVGQLLQPFFPKTMWRWMTKKLTK
jgi:sterol desaturase/sphingolipid hydroxylase (fatty acid hydroxylase superfamily)